MRFIGTFFGVIMLKSYQLTGNYGIAIILFTLVTKIILMPISVLVQKNSIKMVKMYPELNDIRVRCMGNKEMIAEEEYNLYKREKYHPMLDLIPVVLQLVVLMGVVEGIRGLNIADKTFTILDLSVIPSENLGISIIIPILAALSAWLMCYTQNKANVLQSEQSKTNQITTLVISVGLSLYLGFFVEGGIGFYWIISNLMSIALMYILNAIINPNKYIDYEALEKSKNELEKMKNYSSTNKNIQNKEYISREKADYKRFEKYSNKQIVFYSEKNGFYKYFRDVIEYIIKKTDIVVHYISSDPEDEIFSIQNDSFQTYYIGEKKLIVLMLKMDADIVVMTMPDLQKYHIKRSLVRTNIEYIYMDHGIGSINMMLRKHALDYFDTIFVSNYITEAEIRKQEEIYGLKPKTIVQYGFSLIDNMTAKYKTQVPSIHTRPQILIAPSWQEDNLIDLCIEGLLDNILRYEYDVILRPHPQYVRHFEGKLQLLKERYKEYKNFTLQMDFASDNTVFNADILITDWSGIAYEYSFATSKPVLFVNTPMKVMNPDYKDIPVVPFDIEIRNKIGIEISPENISEIGTYIEQLLHDESFSVDSMENMKNKYLFNNMHSAEIGAKYIIQRLIEYSHM